MSYPNVPLDPNNQGELDAGEFSFGAGLVPKGLENAPPSLGMYRGKSPDCTEKITASLDPRG
jgi:hypothetical protein